MVESGSWKRGPPARRAFLVVDCATKDTENVEEYSFFFLCVLSRKRIRGGPEACAPRRRCPPLRIPHP